MYGQSHAGLGWLIGVVSPASDRKLRVWCVAAALLPDIDALTYVLGIDAYAKLHHSFGHNIFLGFLCVAGAVWHFRNRPLRPCLLAVFLVTLCFASHLLTDMKLSGWEVKLLWPFSQRGFEFKPNLSLGAPLNYWLVYILMGVPWLLPFFGYATPLDLLSPRLDHLVRNAFRKKTLACAACGGSCNNQCDRCGKATCMRHGRLDWRFRIACPGCASGGAKA